MKTNTSPDSGSILLKHGHILTLDSTFTEYSDGYILINNGVIREIGDSATLPTADYAIDLAGDIVCPGFINTHTHLAASLLRGLGNDRDLMDWLQNYIWPHEHYMTENDCYVGTQLALVEMIRSGTTTYSDMYFHSEATLRATLETGFRGVISYGMIDLEGEEKREKELMLTRKLLDAHHQKYDLVSFAIAPHTPYTCSKELLEEAYALSKKYDVPYHIHIAETQNEVDMIREKTGGLTPVQYLDQLGVLDENTLGAHMVHLDEKDIEIITKQKVNVAHCPHSNLKLASGFAPIPKYLHNDVVVGLGTDGASSNNNLNMVREMQTAAIMHKGYSYDPKVVSAKEVVKMATISGAQALNLDHKVGSLEVGKEADLLVINTKHAHLRPLHSPYVMIVYSMHASDIKHTMVKGQWLMKDRVLTTLDESHIISSAETSIAQIKKKKKEDDKNESRAIE